MTGSEPDPVRFWKRGIRHTDGLGDGAGRALAVANLLGGGGLGVARGYRQSGLLAAADASE